ncbi:hypothetical protein V1478_006418 [Vespula squamosa]|uniref:Uncharacterized protein n=1 Tax=Vespula squamosa TaxID=30214 RepID=A0ABD2B7S6_VESSQ
METFTESNGECPPVSSRFPKYPAFPGAFRRVMPFSGWISNTVMLRLLALTSNIEATCVLTWKMSLGRQVHQRKSFDHVAANQIYWKSTLRS